MCFGAFPGFGNPGIGNIAATPSGVTVDKDASKTLVVTRVNKDLEAIFFKTSSCSSHHSGVAIISVGKKFVFKASSNK